MAGNSKDALVDMTGGVGERVAMEDYRTPEQQKDLFRILKHSKENHSLMSASIAVCCYSFVKVSVSLECTSSPIPNPNPNSNPKMFCLIYNTFKIP